MEMPEGDGLPQAKSMGHVHHKYGTTQVIAMFPLEIE
jgi:hypothetical protein